MAHTKHDNISYQNNVFSTLTIICKKMIPAMSAVVKQKSLNRLKIPFIYEYILILIFNIAC